MSLTYTELLADIEPVVRGWIAQQIGDHAATNDPSDQFSFEFSNLADGSIIYYDATSFEWRNTEGNNVYIGSGAGASITTAGASVFVGASAGALNEDAGGNVFVGADAGAANVSGLYLTFVGYQAGLINTDSGSTFLGYGAGSINTSGTDLVFVGYRAGGVNSTGDFNVSIGKRSGYHNATGSNNVDIGFEAGEGTVGNNKSGCVHIGYQAGEANDTSNRLYISNSNTATPLIYGEFDTPLLTVNGAITITGATTFIADNWEHLTFQDVSAASSANTFMGMVSTATDTYFGLDSNRNPVDGVFGEVGMTHAYIRLHTKNVDSDITFATASANNTAATVRMTIDKAGLVTPSFGVEIDGSTDIVQLTVGSHSTQTSNLVEFLDDGGTMRAAINEGGRYYNYVIGAESLNLSASAPAGANLFAAAVNAFRDNNTGVFTIGTTYLARVKATTANASTTVMYAQKCVIESTESGGFDASASDAAALKLEVSISGGAMTRDYGLWVGNMGHANIGTTYGIKLDDQTASGTVWSIYSGAGVVSFGDDLQFRQAVTISTTGGDMTISPASNLNVTVDSAFGGSHAPLGVIHVDQAAADGAKPVAYFDQADLDQPFFQFETTIGIGNAIEAIGTKTLTITHFIMVELPGGLTRYIPAGTIA